MSFAKLDTGIVNSTLWVQPHDVLRVWIAMLAQCDQSGFVHSAAPSLAHLCMVPLDRMREIVTLLEAPDPDSRSSENDGRRIVKVDGGWQIVNYLKYREARSTEERKQYQRQWDRENRPNRSRNLSPSDSTRQNPTIPTKAEGEEEAEKKELRGSPVGDHPPKERIASKERLKQVTADAVAAFNATLGKPHGQLAAVHLVNEVRENQVRRCVPIARAICERMNGEPQVTAKFWADYWTEIDRDEFKSGRQTPGKGHENWKPDFEYLTRKDVMTSVFDKAMSEAA